MNFRPFKSVLVANRGEIAYRVIWEAQFSGLRAIAVYSDADANALFVREAQEAVRIGPAPAVESYLNIEAILAAARRTGAEAVHPGYGFLSENAAFARAVTQAGLVWIGPPPEAIAAMGDKARAKQIMIQADVPTLPGWQGGDQSTDNLARQAAAIGYPLLIKAVAGGGGRGMRIVRSAEAFNEALASAKREAQSAFGDDAVLLERFVERGRHVEIQIFADTQGNTIHLGERDCSAQRRRQKVVEEAPSPAVDEALRARMGAAAVKAAEAVGYVGAGTVEFLLDDEGGFYFLEMNTRLQVEHPVTEAVTGTNLVEWQFDIAAGRPLPLKQSEVSWRGWAVEARLYAEDPYNGFAPQVGEVLWFDPLSGRVDEAVFSGDQVSAHYDPMVAKFVGHGPTREAAIAKLRHDLVKTPLLGVTTNRDFLLCLLDCEAFLTGEMTTGDLDQWAEAQSGPFAPKPAPFDAVALASAWFAGAPKTCVRSAAVTQFDLRLVVNGEAMTVRVYQDNGAIRAEFGDDVREVEVLDSADNEIRVRIDGVVRYAKIAQASGVLYIALDDRIVRIREASPWGGGDATDPSKIVAPVSGALVALHVTTGDAVKAGQVLAVMEAMKMEMRLVAEADGVVADIHLQAGAQAPGGMVLIELDLGAQE